MGWDRTCVGVTAEPAVYHERILVRDVGSLANYKYSTTKAFWLVVVGKIVMFTNQSGSKKKKKKGCLVLSAMCSPSDQKSRKTAFRSHEVVHFFFCFIEADATRGKIQAGILI